MSNPTTPLRCEVESCEKRQFGHLPQRDLCFSHNRNLRLYGSPTASRPKRFCSQQHCGKIHFAKGLCKSHYTKNKPKKQEPATSNILEILPPT